MHMCRWIRGSRAAESKCCSYYWTDTRRTNTTILLNNYDIIIMADASKWISWPILNEPSALKCPCRHALIRSILYELHVWIVRSSGWSLGVTVYYFHFAFYINAFISTTSTVTILCTCPIVHDKLITYCWLLKHNTVRIPLCACASLAGAKVTVT